MKPKVYIETSVVSYLTARLSRDLIVAGHQQVTQDWWQTHRQSFDLVASQLVIQEASAGHPEAAQKRLEVLQTTELLKITEKALSLSVKLVKGGPLPSKAAEDALHIAIAVTNGVDYLLTWNCTHIANASMRSRVEAICRSNGYEPAIICTPEELLGE